MEYTDTELLAAVSYNLQRGHAVKVGKLVNELLNRGVTAEMILNRGLISGMD